MIDERTEKHQKSVDRARAQSHLILRRSLDELRKLQKGRTIQEQPTSADGPPKSGLNSFCNPVGQVPDLPSTKPMAASAQPPVTKNIPRNAPCPCRSGAKYKKCCGGPAAQALNKAA